MKKAWVILAAFSVAIVLWGCGKSFQSTGGNQTTDHPTPPLPPGPPDPTPTPPSQPGLGFTAITYSPFPGHPQTPRSGSAINISPDGGATWERIFMGERGLVGKRDPKTTQIMAFDKDGDLWAIGTGDGIFVSRNAGVSWQFTQGGEYGKSRGDNGFGNERVYDVEVDGQNIYATTGEGFSSSFNQGFSWDTQFLTTGLGYSRTTSGVNLIGNLLMVATFGGISLSTDYGLSWQHQSKNLGDTSRGLADSHVFFDIQTDGEKLVVGSHQGGLSISWDAGATWQTVDNTTPGFSASNSVRAIALKDRNIYAATDDGLSISLDNGTTWRTVNDGYPGFPCDHWITSVDTKGSYVLIGTLNGGVGLSSDEGLTWFTMDITNGLPSNSVHDVDFH